jgi:rfaE bifunctional protein kinase chain/domain
VTVCEVLAEIPRLSVLVVGDVCLDRWCRYEPSFAEPSRETGLRRIAVVEVERTPGGGGTVASNLAALGAGKVAVLGAVGDDGHAAELREALLGRGIVTELIVDEGRLTFCYTKLLNRSTGIEDLSRVDFVSERALPPEIERQVLERFQELAPRFDVVIVSDQMEQGAGGTVTAGLREVLAGFALAYPEKVVWGDSRVRAEDFRHVLMKLNEDEANQASSRIGRRGDYDGLRLHIGHEYMIVTSGAAGALVVTAAGEIAVPGRKVDNPLDLCGAGDSFNAGAAMAFRICGDLVQATRFGNLVASITITKQGTGTASASELLAVARGEGEAEECNASRQSGHD